VCWGSNQYGERADASSGSTSLLSPLTGAGVTQVAAAYGETCAVDSLQHVRCLGLNVNNQLGDGVAYASENKTAIPTNVVGLDGGGALFPVIRVEPPCAILEGPCGPGGPGQVVCWSFLNENGNATAPLPIPVP
jgi:hypothetical protein